jgi:hypothetical protein
MDDGRTALDKENLIKVADVEVSRQISDIRRPDYDPRKRQKNKATSEQYVVIQSDSNNVDEIIQNSKDELQVIQKKYSQVLDDPIAKKKLEDQAKIVGVEYKKALLVKLKNGEL